MNVWMNLEMNCWSVSFVTNIFWDRRVFIPFFFSYFHFKILFLVFVDCFFFWEKNNTIWEFTTFFDIPGKLQKYFLLFDYLFWDFAFALFFFLKFFFWNFLKFSNFIKELQRKIVKGKEQNTNKKKTKVKNKKIYSKNNCEKTQEKFQRNSSAFVFWFFSFFLFFI